MPKADTGDAPAALADLARENPIAAFERIYARRAAAVADAIRSGGQAVAYLGADTPIELIVAAGMTPVRLMGDPALACPDANLLLGPRSSQRRRSQLQQVLAGACDGVDGLVIARNAEELVWLFYVLRALRRTDPAWAGRLPQLHLFDLLHMPHRTSGDYNRVRMRQLRAKLGAWSGREITDDALADAVGLCNETRHLLQRLRSLRSGTSCRLSGVQSLQVIGAGQLIGRDRYAVMLRDLLDRQTELPPLPGARVFVTGGAHDTWEVYAAIEAAGAVVVGEDHDWGDPGGEGLVEEAAGDLIDAITDRYHLGPADGAKHAIARRAAYTTELAVQAGAELVVCFIRKGDEGPRWDVPDQRQALAARGVPMLLLDDQDYALAEPGAITAQVAQSLAGARRRGQPRRAR